METSDASSPVEALRQLQADLARFGISPVALTGGIAVGVWFRPRSTDDFDLCGVVPLSAVDKLLARYDGHRVGPGESALATALEQLR